MGLFNFGKDKLSKYILQKFGWQSAFDATDSRYIATYYTAVKILSENISKLTPTIRDENDVIIEDHDLNKKLQLRPNQYQNRQKFYAQVESNRCNNGNGYVYVDRSPITGRPNSLHPIPSHAVKGVKVKTNGSLYYEVDFDQCPMIPNSGSALVKSDDLLHFNFAATDTLFSEAPVDILSDYAGILSKAAQMIDSFYANNATSAMAIETTFDKAALAKTVQESNEKFIEKYVGVKNAGTPINLPPNTKLVPIHQKFAEAQVVETQRHAREEIANLFGIPKFMFESTDNNESIEQQTRQFLAFTINPILEIYVAEMESKLLTAQEYNKGYRIRYDVEKLIETDIKTQVEVIALQVSKGVMTPDEAARKLGNKPIDSKWGNVHYIQTQNQPLELYEVWGNNQINNNEQKTESNEENEQGAEED